MVSVGTAEALTPVEENEIKDKINVLEKKIVTIENDITKQKEKIAQLEVDIDIQKNNLREARAGSDGGWDSVQNIIAIEDLIIQIEQDIVSAKAQLDSLLDTKNKFIRDKNKLQVQVTEDKQIVPTINSTEIIPTNSTEIPTNSTEVIPIPTNSTEIIITAPINNKQIIYDSSLSVGLADRNIGIVLSKLCITMNQNNFTSTCPSYEELLPLDSSNTDVSGGFEYVNGDYTRMKAPYENSERWYDKDSQMRIFVDPPGTMASKIKIITLHPNFDTYTGAEGVTVSDGEITRVVYHDRWVDSKCNKATVNTDKLLELLADTIFYLRNDCNSNATSFVEKEIITTNATDMDITTSQKYQDDKRLEYIKEHCIYKFKSC